MQRMHAARMWAHDACMHAVCACHPCKSAERAWFFSMLEALSALASKRLVLASASPRRLDLLRQVGLQPLVQPSSFEENLDKGKFTAAQYAVETARHKALDVAASCQADLVIAADTVQCQCPHV